jgi:hypothetical protein
MEPVDLLADTRRYLPAAIKQLEAINAGAPIAKPVTREQAVNIVTEQIGLFESVLRRYGGRKTPADTKGPPNFERAPPTDTGRPESRPLIDRWRARAQLSLCHALMVHTLGCFSLRRGEPRVLAGAYRSGHGFDLPFAGEFGPERRHKEPIRSPAFGLHSLPASRRLCSAVAPLTRLFGPL